uniref:Si:dkey-48p11.3 n=1 Tax=Neogobius melanostomus TaxID=47308 RepID=A0A8C6WE91_9GOBI
KIFYQKPTKKGTKTRQKRDLGNKTKLEKMRSVQTGVQIIKRESDVFVFSAGASADFLPQMAEANEKLKRQMEAASPEQFHIENVEEAAQVIEMDVALVELDGSDGSDFGSERETDDSDSDSDSDDDEGEVTENNIRLPGDKKRKAQIQVLQEEEK